MNTYKRYVVTMRLGNDGMVTAEDIASALREAATALERGEAAGNIRDANGNVVGRRGYL